MYLHRSEDDRLSVPEREESACKVMYRAVAESRLALRILCTALERESISVLSQLHIIPWFSHLGRQAFNSIPSGLDEAAHRPVSASSGALPLRTNVVVSQIPASHD